MPTLGEDELGALAAEAGDVAARVEAGEPVHAALNAWPAAPVRFVPQAALPEGQAYEQFIFEQRACPSRDNLHDLFNGLTWLAYPRTKARLNELQAADIARHGVSEQRGDAVADEVCGGFEPCGEQQNRGADAFVVIQDVVAVRDGESAE